MIEVMKIMFFIQLVDGCWGEKVIWSINNDGIVLYFNGKDDFGFIQCVVCKIDGMGIKYVVLSGEGWNIDCVWVFWVGYKGLKGQCQVEWLFFDDVQCSELDNCLMIIDWVCDIINVLVEELGLEQLVQCVVDLLCGVVGEKISYCIIKGEDLCEQGYFGLYIVGCGFECLLVLLVLDYNLIGDKEVLVYVCLVGKGIIFDFGGYSIK